MTSFFHQCKTLFLPNLSVKIWHQTRSKQERVLEKISRSSTLEKRELSRRWVNRISIWGISRKNLSDSRQLNNHSTSLNKKSKSKCMSLWRPQISKAKAMCTVFSRRQLQILSNQAIFCLTSSEQIRCQWQTKETRADLILSNCENVDLNCY